MLLIDADILLHLTTAVTERDIDWGDGMSTIHADHKEMQVMAKRELNKIIEGVDIKNPKVILCFSGDQNFRKALYPDYKANRTGRKPVGYAVLKKWLMENYMYKSVHGLEADDLMSIMQTSGKYGKTVIVSDDKDMLQVPGKIYRPRTKELLEVSVSDGIRHHMIQTLTGDKADNYPGCPGVGPKTAEDILDGDPLAWWSAVVEAYTKRGLTEADALLQARVAKILQIKDFNQRTKEPILWNPPRSTASTAATTSTAHAATTSSPKIVETAQPETTPPVKRGRSSTSKAARSSKKRSQAQPSTSPTTTPSTK